MELLMIILSLSPWIIPVITAGEATLKDNLTNSSDAKKDMYVINAMVYQVGILTNKTDDESSNNITTGNQETLTFFYHNNGSSLDLGNIPEPLMTNVTAQSIVGVAPVTYEGGKSYQPASLPWTALNRLTSMPQIPAASNSDKQIESRQTRKISHLLDNETAAGVANENLSLFTRYRRSLDNSHQKREIKDNTPIEVIKGSAAIPQGVGVQSVAIPPLLSLNNNFSQIPVPIPNTSIVHYAKVNTLFQSP